MAKNKKNQKKVTTNSKKRKKFSIGDYMALGVFSLIILAALGATGYFYGYHRPQVNEAVTQRAEEFTQLLINVDYEDFSFEPLYEYLSPALVRNHYSNEKNLDNEYKAKKYTRAIHETKTTVVESGWDKAKVQVKVLAEENSILHEEPEVNWSIMHYELQNFNDKWEITKYTREEINE